MWYSTSILGFLKCFQKNEFRVCFSRASQENFRSQLEVAQSENDEQLQVPLGPWAASSTTFTSSEFGNQLKHVKFKPLKLEVSKCVSNSQKDPKQWKNQIIQNWREPTSLVQLKEHRNIRSKCSPDGITVWFPHKLHGYMVQLVEKSHVFHCFHSFFSIHHRFLPVSPMFSPSKSTTSGVFAASPAHLGGHRQVVGRGAQQQIGAGTHARRGGTGRDLLGTKWGDVPLGKWPTGGWWLMVNDG